MKQEKLNIFSGVYKSKFSKQLKNIMLQMNFKLSSKFKEIHKKKGLLLSRQFEILMENQLKEDN